MRYLSEIKIFINGAPFKDFLHVNVNHNLYGFSSFSMECRFDTMEKPDEFLIEKSKEYLGSPVLIQLQSKELHEENSQDGLKFRGIITRVSGTRTTAEENSIILEGQNYEVLLKSKPRSRAFTGLSLYHIVDEVLKPYDRGMLRPKISPRNNEEIEYLVQYSESDLDFLRRLSIRFGEWFFFDGEELVFGRYDFKEADFILGDEMGALTYSIQTNPLNFELTGINKVKPNKYKVDSGQVNVDSDLNYYGKFSKDKSLKLYPEKTSDYYANYGVGESNIATALNSVVELQTKADAINLTDITGTANSPNFLMAQKAVLKGLREEFLGEINYGKYIITGCSYSFDRSLNFGCQFSGISAESSIPENTNPNFILKSSPQVAIVTNNDDPEKLGRIKVRFPWMKDETHWINVNTPYTQKSAGFYFIPSQHSHVMINFEGGDIDRPYCEGAFYEKNVAPDEEWVGNADKQNAKILGIRTFKGNTIEFHDSDGGEKIRIYDTNRKNEIILNSADGVLDIKAQGSMNINVGGSLKITANDIEIKTKEGIDIEAGTNIGIKAGTSVKQEGTSIEMASTSSFKISASTVEIKGKASLTAEGTGTAELKSGGMTTISGSLVKIN